jgi:hypothetical protein
MRKTIFALLTVLALASFVADKPKKVIFFGDSITQAGVKPNGYHSYW